MPRVPRFEPRLNPGSVTSNNKNSESILEARVESILAELANEYPEVKSNSKNSKDWWLKFVGMNKSPELLNDPRVKYIEYVSRPDVNVQKKFNLKVPRGEGIESWVSPNNTNKTVNMAKIPANVVTPAGPSAVVPSGNTSRPGSPSGSVASNGSNVGHMSNFERGGRRTRHKKRSGSKRRRHHTGKRKHR
jgi:hypothetical protein